MSRREICVCDCCGKEIPVVKREDIFGIERDKISLDFGGRNHEHYKKLVQR